MTFTGIHKHLSFGWGIDDFLGMCIIYYDFCWNSQTFAPLSFANVCQEMVRRFRNHLRSQFASMVFRQKNPRTRQQPGWPFRSIPAPSRRKVISYHCRMWSNRTWGTPPESKLSESSYVVSTLVCTCAGYVTLDSGVSKHWHKLDYSSRKSYGPPRANLRTPLRVVQFWFRLGDKGVSERENLT